MKEERVKRAAVRIVIACTAVVMVQCAAHRFPYVRPRPKEDRRLLERQRAQDYFIRGRDYERRGLPQMAARLYEMAYEFEPTSDVLRHLLAEKYLELSKYPQALLTIKNGREISELSVREKELLATAYMKMGQLAKAVEVLESLSVLSDRNVYSLALLYESLGNTDKAIGTFLRFLERKPAARGVGLKVAQLMLRKKRGEQADSLLAVLESRFDSAVDFTYLRGVSALMSSDTAAAQTRFLRVLEVDSVHEDALQSLGQVYIQRKEYDSAIAVYRKLYRTQLWGEVYGRTLALLYYYDEQYDSSAALLQRLLETAMQDGELHYYLGLVAAEMDSVELARLELEKSLALQSSREDAWQQLCLLGIRTGNWEQAMADAKRFVAALGDKASSWRMLGYVYAARGKFEEASQALHRSLSIDSTNSRTWFELGSTYERRKQYDSAAAAFRRALAIEPRDHVTANYLGYMWADQDVKLDSARALIELALEEEPENGAYLDSYAWVLYRLGDIEGAYSCIVKSIEQIDDDAVVYAHLGDIHVKRGDYAAAVEAYQKSLSLEPENEDEIRERLEAARERLEKGNP